MRSLQAHLDALIRHGQPARLMGRLVAPTEMPALAADSPYGDMPLFCLSTEGEATDNNIVLAYWDTNRANNVGIPVIWAHEADEMHLGYWRGIQVVNRQLIAYCDLDPEDQFAQQCKSKIKRDYLRGVSIGWIPGAIIRRGDLPPNDPFYRQPVEDDCGDPMEGYVLGSQQKPNILLEASLCSVPAQDTAGVIARLNGGANRAASAIKRGEQPTTSDIDRLMAVAAQDSRVRNWILRAVRSDPAMAGWVRSLVVDTVKTIQSASPPVEVEPTLSSLLGG